MEQYETLTRELSEMLSKSFTYKDLDELGKDIFGRKYDTHKLEGLSEVVSISPTNAAKRLVSECAENGRLEKLIVTLVQLDGNYLNDKIVSVRSLDNLLYHQAQHGMVYDEKRRKFIEVTKDRTLMPNWGVLRDNKQYELTVGSVDIVKNSILVKKYGSTVMERVYKQLLEFFRSTMAAQNGRVWSWQGDGGIVAFPSKQDSNLSVSCCISILIMLPLFNMRPDNPITSDIALRIGLDHGEVRFSNDTGSIVSETINYAAHLEKSGTETNGISISDSIYASLTPKMKKIFSAKKKFEGRYAYSSTFTHYFTKAKTSQTDRATSKK